MQAFRTSVQRKYFIDKKIRDKTYPTAATLAKDYEIEKNRKVDPRTIASDISELRQIYNAPIKYDAKNKGYIYTDESFRLNVLEGESSGIPIESITQQVTTTESIPEWQKDLLSSFINKVLPRNSVDDTIQADFSTENITVLPSKMAQGSDSGIEDCFLKALKKGQILSLEIQINDSTVSKADFLPLHLICQDEERLFFCKEISDTKHLGDKFSLLNLATVKTAVVSYSSNKDKELNKELAEGSNKPLSAMELGSHPKRQIKANGAGFSFWAQTTGNADIEIVMAGNGARHIFVFSCFASIQNREKNSLYKKVGEFILNL